MTARRRLDHFAQLERLGVGRELGGDNLGDARFVVFGEAHADLLPIDGNWSEGLSAATNKDNPEGIGHSSCLPAQRPGMGVMLNR